MYFLRSTRVLSLFVACALCTQLAQRAQGLEYRVELFGVVQNVTASYDPLYDPSEPPPPPEVVPAFAARFAAGHNFHVLLEYGDESSDQIAAEYWGLYAIANVGAITIDGEQFEIGPGVISIQTDQPYMPRTDSFFFHTYTPQSITEPVAANAIWLDFGFEGDDLYDTDAIGVPPNSWDRTFGYLQFDSGLVWQGLEFSVERVEVAIVPEPSAAWIAALLVGITFFGRCRATRSDNSTRLTL